MGPQFPQCLLSLSFRVIAFLTGVRWYLIVVLLYISLKVSDVEPLFMSLMAMGMPSLGKCQFRYFVHFLIGLFELLLMY